MQVGNGLCCVNQCAREAYVLEYRVGQRLKRAGLQIKAQGAVAEYSASARWDRDAVGRVAVSIQRLQQARQVGARDMEAIYEVAVADLTPWQRKYLLNNKIGQASPPTRTPNGFLIMMPCERTQQAAGIPSAKALEERMTRERLELMAQKYMRDLRRSAYIDLRQ